MKTISGSKLQEITKGTEVGSRSDPAKVAVSFSPRIQTQNSKRRRAKLDPSSFLFLLLGIALTALNSPAASFVYETPAEFLTSGDFNGDGAPDVLVLDKTTGNARVGYLDANTGALTWSSPLATGVENATGCAVGRFLATGRDVLAVTAPDLNRIHLVSLANPNSAGIPVVVTPAGLGPHTLVTLANPQGGAPPNYNFLLSASSYNPLPSERLDLLALSAGTATAVGQFGDFAPFERGNALQLSVTAGTLAAGLLRGSNDAAFLEALLTADTNFVAGITNGTNDILQIWQFASGPPSALALSNLPPGSDYVFGLFNGETLPRFAVYVSGQSNLILQPMSLNGSALAFGNALSMSFSQAIRRVFYLDRGADGNFIIQFDNGVQALGFPSGAPTLSALYLGTVGAGGNVLTGVVPLGNGQLVLLDAPAGSPISIHSQTLRFDGTNYVLRNASNLSSVTSRSLRANVWLFRNEPFVNSSPGFVASASVADWTDNPVYPYTGTTVAESDNGPAAGLANPTTTGIGPMPSGNLWGIPNQYDDLISIFSFGGARVAEMVIPRISPPPGTYPGPTNISFFTAGATDTMAPLDHVVYQVGTSDQWHDYNVNSAPFWITNDVTIRYYGTNESIAGRSALLSATYILGNPAAPPSNPGGQDTGNTNGIPVNTNLVHLSAKGTLFYGRRSNSGVGTIWAINLDGTDDTYITQGARPRASRDGRYLAFLRGTNPCAGQGDIWRLDLLTGREDLLFANPSVVVGFDWFADDSALIADFGCSLFKINTNTFYANYLLGSQCHDDAPVLNPIDGRIAFHNTSNAPLGLYLAAANGSGRTNILSLVGGAIPAWPAWSHDGGQIAVGQSPTSQSVTRNLYVVSPDGTALSQLTAFSDPTNGWFTGAIWFPSDNALIGAGEVRGTNGLWILPLNASRNACQGTLSRLPTSPGDDIDFAGTIVVSPAPAAPMLFVRLEPDRVVVYWSTNSAGFNLEAAGAFPAPAIWSAVAGQISVVGANYEYSEPRAALLATKFFRLHWRSGL